MVISIKVDKLFSFLDQMLFYKLNSLTQQTMMKTKILLRLFASSVLVGILVLGPSIGDSQALAQTYTTTDATATTVPVTISTTSTTTSTPMTTLNIPLCEITRNLTLGSMGDDVRCLQRYLNASGFLLTTIGAGSPGNESMYFGPLTRQALIRWQNFYASSILTPLGLSSGTGFWGNRSFNHYANLVRIALGVQMVR